MKWIKLYESFVSESMIDIAPELDLEISDLVEAITKNPECEMVDQGYIEITTPFDLNPDSNNPDWKNKIGIVFYPELLSYGNGSSGSQRTPWICCKITLEGEKDQAMVRDLLKWTASLLEKSGYNPFMDEDAKLNHWKEEKKNGYTDYSCFVNPSYPDGHWENHTLE